MTAHKAARRDIVRAVINSAYDRAAHLNFYLARIIPKVLTKNGVTWYTISEECLDDATVYCGKDIEKIAIFQKDDVNIYKMIGYACFWIRKIKPIKSATKEHGGPIPDINELFSLWMMQELTCLHLKRSGETNYRVKQVRKRFDSYFMDEERMNYLMLSLRARTYGPHHYVILIDSMLAK